MMMNGGGSNSFNEAAASVADGYLNLQGFLQFSPSTADGAINLRLQGATVADQRNSPNLAAPINNSGASNAGAAPAAPASRYESQKRRDWNTFGQYLRNHRPPLALSKCSGAHVLEFLRYLDQFGKTKVHTQGCPFFGHPQPPAACACPLRQAWGSLDALIGRLRAAFDENGAGRPESNPFGARAVRLYLRDVRETQAKARGIAYEKKKRKRPPPASASAVPSATAQHHQASNINAAAGASSLILSSAHDAEPVYSSSLITQVVGMNMDHENEGAPPINHPTVSLGFPPDHPYHHHHLLQAAPACPGPRPPPLIPSFN